MSLRKCPDCEEFHRGRCLVCRRCARIRLAKEIVSRETKQIEVERERCAG